MKCIFSILATILFSYNLVAQEKNDSVNYDISVNGSSVVTIDRTIMAINTKNASYLYPYLSKEFTISGHSGEIAKLILKQLFLQMNDSVIHSKSISMVYDDGKTIITKGFYYKKMGYKEAVFTLDNDNSKLLELKLFNMSVKTKEETIIEESVGGQIIIVPFKLYGKLIVIEASLNGEKKNFILDTGAPDLILNYKSERKSISNSNGVNGNISGADLKFIKEFYFQGIRIANQEIISMNLEHLEKELGIELAGLIGYGVIKNRDLLFDYQKNHILLLQPNYTKDYLKETFSAYQHYKSTFLMESHLPIVKINIENKEYLMAIDCGAEMNLFDKTFENKIELKNIEIDSLVGAENKSSTVKKGILNSMKIGDYYFNQTNFIFNDISLLNKSYKTKIDGLLGYEVLSKQPTLISFINKEIIFLKKK